MNLPFDEEKAAQAAALFLRLRGTAMSYMKLIKLLYLADRQSLLRFGKPITMDVWYSMKHGPVLSKVLNLITDPSRVDSEGEWSRLISAPLGDREVELLVETIPNNRLSAAEEKLITEIFHQYGGMNRWKLVELLHTGELFPEWRKPTPANGRIPITLYDVFTTEMDGEEAERAELELLSMLNTCRAGI